MAFPDFGVLQKTTRTVLSTLLAQLPLSPRRSRWSASDVFEGCPLRLQAGPCVRRGRTLQVCHTGRLVWPCPRPWKLDPSPFQRVSRRFSRSPSSYLHPQFQGPPPVSIRIRDTLR